MASFNQAGEKMAYKDRKVQEVCTVTKGYKESKGWTELGDFLDRTAAKAIKEWKDRKDQEASKALQVESHAPSPKQTKQTGSNAQVGK